MSDNLTNLPRVQAIATDSEVRNHNNSPSDCPKATVAKPVKLPYQATHQVELLHLHAEIEALLQQVRTLRQQRLVGMDDSLEVEIARLDLPTLAIR